MPSLNGWRPQKQLEHGDQQVEAARQFLETHGGNLSQESLDEANGRLDNLNDFRQVLTTRRLLKRMVLARQYAKDADTALNRIYMMRPRRRVRFDRPNRL